MAFRPNFRQQRATRDRAARARQDEKLQKLHERAAKRKAEREGPADTPAPAEDGPAAPAEKAEE